MKPNPQILKMVIDAIMEDRAIEVEATDTLENMGYDSLEIANLEILLETKMDIYTASTNCWAFKEDTVNTLALKLENLHAEHKRKYPA